MNTSINSISFDMICCVYNKNKIYFVFKQLSSNIKLIKQKVSRASRRTGMNFCFCPVIINPTEDSHEGLLIPSIIISILLYESSLFPVMKIQVLLLSKIWHFVHKNWQLQIESRNMFRLLKKSYTDLPNIKSEQCHQGIRYDFFFFFNILFHSGFDRFCQPFANHSDKYFTQFRKSSTYSYVYNQQRNWTKLSHALISKNSTTIEKVSCSRWQFLITRTGEYDTNHFFLLSCCDVLFDVSIKMSFFNWNKYLFSELSLNL